MESENEGQVEKQQPEEKIQQNGSQGLKEESKEKTKTLKKVQAKEDTIMQYDDTGNKKATGKRGRKKRQVESSCEEDGFDDLHEQRTTPE